MAWTSLRGAISLLFHDNFSQYDVDTPWIWQFELIDKQKEKLEEFRENVSLAPEPSFGPSMETAIRRHEEWIRKTVHGMRLQRHSTFGEIPDLVAYSKSFGKEYRYPWSSKDEFGQRTK